MARRNLSLFIDARGRSALHRSGFSRLAFVALPLWALHRRLWWLVPLSLVGLAWVHGAANWLMERFPSPDVQGALASLWLLAESWFVGRHANRLHLALLRRQGYALTATEVPPDQLARHDLLPAGSETERA
jgi:hypothetical protein